MGLWGNSELGRADTERKDREARRRKKIEKQEKRVERLNEPLAAWLCKTFRVITVGGTIILAGLEVRNSMLIGADNMMQRVLFTALGAWLVFGLVWAGSAIAQMVTLKKNGEDSAAAFRKYIINAAVPIAGMVILTIAFMMT